MLCDILGKLVAKIVGLPEEMWGTLYDLVEKLGGKEGGEWIVALKKFLRKENPWQAITSNLLDFIDTVIIPATDKFVASNYFTDSNKTVKITWIGDGFDWGFLNKVEKSQVEVTLQYSKLKKVSMDAPIMTELESKKEIMLAKIWELLKKQPNGESGTLSINGCLNIFYYVRNVEENFGVVFVGWDGFGWRIDAYLGGDDLRKWKNGARVFSRNS